MLAKELNQTGDIAIVSAAASATNQNAWIGYMKQELKKYPKMKLVSTVYGNDDPTTATQVTQGLLQQYPNLKGIISPTTVGIAAAAAVLDTPKYRGKIALTGLGTPDSLKKYVSDGTIKAFVLWNPADLGYLAGVRGGRARVGQASTAPGPDVQRGQARHVHGRRRQDRPARPAVRLQLRQHQPVQLLTRPDRPSVRVGSRTVTGSGGTDGWLHPAGQAGLAGTAAGMDGTRSTGRDALGTDRYRRAELDGQPPDQGNP